MRRGLMALLVSALLVACGGDEERKPLDSAAEGQEREGPGAEAIEFGSALAQIRGHLFVAAELLEGGDEKGAALHAAHPAEELLDFVGHELEEHDADAATGLSALLDKAPDAVRAGDLAGVVEGADGLTSEALTAVVGEEADSSSYKGSVVASLLATAAHEYEESLSGDKVVRPDEYHDAYGFLHEAQRLYEEIAPDIEAEEPEEAEEIDEAFETLTGALPGTIPPVEAAPAEDVEAAASLIGHELEETVGAAPVEESNPEEVAANIERLLDEVVAAYEAGDTDEASEIAAEAYLENYEVIEAEVIEYAPDINEELEPLLGADLRRQIDAGVPVEEIEDMTAHAKELLASALEALEGAHE